jgi:hypothetical protein
MGSMVGQAQRAASSIQPVAPAVWAIPQLATVGEHSGTQARQASWSRRASQDVSFVRNLTSLSGYVRSSLTVSTSLLLRAIWQILAQPSGRIARTRPAILVIPTSGIYTGGYHR